jgi:hypothetical protein
MPGTWRAEARTTIQAAPETVHPWIGDVERWPQWFPWNASKDPSVRYEFPGPRSGVGAVLVWKSEKVGHGTMTLTRSDPCTGVAYDLVFQNSRQPAHGEIALASEGGATTVTWTDGGELGKNPIARLFRAPVERMLSQEFADALARLKALVEGQASAPEGTAEKPG